MHKTLHLCKQLEQTLVLVQSLVSMYFTELSKRCKLAITCVPAPLAKTNPTIHQAMKTSTDCRVQGF